jgi:hypothetical protein
VTKARQCGEGRSLVADHTLSLPSRLPMVFDG